MLEVWKIKRAFKQIKAYITNLKQIERIRAIRNLI